MVEIIAAGVVIALLVLQRIKIKARTSAAQIGARFTIDTMRTRWLMEHSHEESYRDQAMSADEALVKAIAKVLSHKPKMRLRAVGIGCLWNVVLVSTALVVARSIIGSTPIASSTIASSEVLSIAGPITIPFLLIVIFYFVRGDAREKWIEIHMGLERFKKDLRERGFGLNNMREHILALNRQIGKAPWPPLIFSWGFSFLFLIWWVAVCFAKNHLQLALLPLSLALLCIQPFLAHRKSWLAFRRSTDALERALEQAPPSAVDRANETESIAESSDVPHVHRRSEN